MADRGDELAVGGELADEIEHLFITAEFVGHPAAGKQDAVEIGRLHVGDRRIARAGIPVLAGIGAALHRAGHRDVGPRLLEAEFGIPEFEVFVVVAHEGEDADAVERTRRQKRGHGSELRSNGGGVQTEAGVRGADPVGTLARQDLDVAIVAVDHPPGESGAKPPRKEAVCHRLPRPFAAAGRAFLRAISSPCWATLDAPIRLATFTPRPTGRGPAAAGHNILRSLADGTAFSTSRLIPGLARLNDSSPASRRPDES